jgi:hypothetical protein
MSGPMAKTPSQYLEAVADQRSTMSMQKTSSIPVPKKKGCENMKR